MEGMAQWAAYVWLIDPGGGRMEPREALGFIRRDGRAWSQDEGLAVFLLLDRLSPTWPAKLLAPESGGLLDLLRAAVRGR